MDTSTGCYGNDGTGKVSTCSQRATLHFLTETIYLAQPITRCWKSYWGQFGVQYNVQGYQDVQHPSDQWTSRSTS